ncbi:hypothetical protein H696_05669 [Fonticula alba]|uniref:Uncharacterized protein n=1 Tax=Fonticula alba TaxID=691883 RepID=A0A058Z117_FONAL|nr:hypothetical protein H696_05669 [Fonticula alba]KCV67944.1 hypothetical protein H696_05669 [Fonticula alba]|eukprot:XP_009497764.1 hypothetical protein H696_05669 [Fonticula alba]
MPPRKKAPEQHSQPGKARQGGTPTGGPPFVVRQEKSYTLLLFDTESQLNAALCRPAAFYEHFQLMGQYTSRADWPNACRPPPRYCGFNAPLADLIEWARCARQDLAPEEAQVLDALLHPAPFVPDSAPEHLHEWTPPRQPRPGIRSYVIALVAGDRVALAHELRHVVFFLDPEYRELSERAWRELTPEERAAVEVDFLNRRYHPRHHIDEFQAYIATEPFTFPAKGRNFPPAKMRTLQLLLTQRDVSALF